MATKKNKSKKSNANLFGSACIVLGLLVILIAFLVNKDRILTNFKDTGFFDRVFGATPEFVQNHESKNSSESETVTLNEKKDVVVEIKTKEPEKVKVEKKEVDIKEIKEEKKEIGKNPTKDIVEEKKEEQKVAVKPSMTDLQLCFVMIDSEGSVVRKQIKRSVPKSDSPLTASLGLLLQGPDVSKSAEKDCMTLIPEGTKLLSAKVQNGVAYLNFNENFEFNSFGAEGYRGQLMQIVYTATAFSTVNSVQFLIDGEKREYLSEAQWIGSPLNRNSF